MTQTNTIFLRLEGPLQAWGDNSKFVIRRCMDAPTKSGLLGLICCAMGVRRSEASQAPIPERFSRLRDMAERPVPKNEDSVGRPARTVLGVLNTLAVAVRIDRPGVRWWDWHTVGAKIGIMRADGKGPKKTASTGEYETLITRREYLADASFLVALQGDSALIEEVAGRLRSPQWPLFLGRKSCPPCLPVFALPQKDKLLDDGKPWGNPMYCPGLGAAMSAVPWRPRLADDQRPERAECLLEWRPSADKPDTPDDAEVWYDSPVSFDPPVHEPRLVLRDSVPVDVGEVLQQHTPPPPRPRADYRNKEYQNRRKERMGSEYDRGLCVFCKQPATTVQHVTYRRAGGGEKVGDLRSLCRLCHDAVTMIEYGLGMGLDRINPEDVRWRSDIIRARAEILRWRSEEGRRRALRAAPEKVRRELLEEEE